MPNIAKHIIITSDYVNGFYVDGQLRLSGKPDYINAETLFALHPQAALYHLDTDSYDRLLNGEGFPEKFSDIPTRLLPS